MSTDDKNSACPTDTSRLEFIDDDQIINKSDEDSKKSEKPHRKVAFPDEEHIVTQYFEPANPWHDVPTTSISQLAAEYLESCRRHNTQPVDSVLEQIRELPECSIGGGIRAPRLTLAQCALLGPAPADALEAVLRKAQFRRLEVDHADIDDEGAEALFDMIEYYESATALSINGPRHFGIRGWQAASRMIKKSSQLSELEVSYHPLEAAHAPVLARALNTHACRLRTLCLQHAQLSGEPLLCLVNALKSNGCIRELRLGDNRLVAADAAQLAALLRLNNSLHTLDLSNNQIQDAGVSHIADALEEQATRTPPSAASSPLSPLHGAHEARGLAVLVLWNNQLTRNCAHYIAKALRFSQSLCVLNIGRNPLGGEAVGALRNAGPLLSLGLQAARLRGDAASALAALVAQRTRLQRLDLRDNKLDETALSAILTALRENTTITQIDLDDPPAEPTSTTLSPNQSSTPNPTLLSLTREIRNRCRHNEPAVGAEPERPAPPLRKISLTCHTAAALKNPIALSAPSTAGCMGVGGVGGEGGRSRLRSPAPSPAASPVPPHHSRFSVTKVCVERTPVPMSSPSGSRFRVVQVAEPPQIQVQSPETPRRKSSSRFSVTRNYDSMYTPVTSPSSLPPKDTASQTERDSCEKATEASEDIDVVLNIIDDCASTKDAVFKPVVKCTDSVKDNGSQTENRSHVEVNNDPQSVKTNSDSNTEQIKRCSVDVNSDVFIDTCEKVSHSETVEGDVIKTETNLVRNTSEVSENDKIDVEVNVTVKTETAAKVHNDDSPKQNVDAKDNAMKSIKAITEDLGNLIQEMKDLSSKTSVLKRVKIETQDVVEKGAKIKKNKSESSLDSPDLEVSRLMTQLDRLDSSSSLEISGSSMESLNTDNLKPIIIQEATQSDSELDRRKPDQIIFSTESSIESTSDSNIVPANSGFLNMSVSSNESVSPIFGKNKKLHGSLSSLEASVSSLDSTKQDKIMMTSADSGIEYSLPNADTSSNEGTLTNNSSLNTRNDTQDTLTAPKRTSSLLDVPALKNKGLDRMRKISWVAPSSSFHIPKEKVEEKVDIKLPTHLEKLLSLFQHPTSLFSRSVSSEEEKKCNTPPRKDSALTSSFWSWGSATEKEREDDSENSTLSERIQVSFVDESFSKKLDSKTPSTDTENTLSEQTFPQIDETKSTEDKVQMLVLDTSFNGNSDSKDLPINNDLNKNLYELPAGDNNKNQDEKKADEPLTRPRSFAAVLKCTGAENLDKQSSPETGQPVDKLPSKIIRGIKENISPENTLTSSMTNTKTLALELNERQIKNQPIVNVWEVLEMEPGRAPIATIEDTFVNEKLEFEELKFIDEKNTSIDSGVTSLEGVGEEKKIDKEENIDIAKDALSYLMYENPDFDTGIEQAITNLTQEGSLAQELKEAEIKEKLLDISPELVIDETLELPEVFITPDPTPKCRTSPIIPDRAKLKKSNSLENLVPEKSSPKTKSIAFKIPDSTPRDIPERRPKLRSRSGSSPKSLPESLNKQFPFTKIDSVLSKKKKKVSSLGKMARDSLLALNMTEEEISEFRRSYKLTSVESLRSLESVSEDANSQSGASIDSRCRSCLRTSQESLMSLDSITEDCKCTDEEKSERPNRFLR